jgi:hypothetical protein
MLPLYAVKEVMISAFWFESAGALWYRLFYVGLKPDIMSKWGDNHGIKRNKSSFGGIFYASSNQYTKSEIKLWCSIEAARSREMRRPWPYCMP